MSDESKTPKLDYLVVTERIAATCARLEKKSELLEAKMNSAFDGIESKLGAGFDRMESKFDIVEWKLARVEFTLVGATMLFFVLLATGFRWI
ncbi:hypothetical protein JMJ56_32780 [Belnapia sp. T18]|uniref:DUF1640 domain-containing protein n=1 Tax=Belnapia arida TaxID=2804533 RepID=A0ABS1UEX9_9PROT|nr:hypothetical protein [Belnapia arida]MBL6082735.1 hypothetical protein [Belnapia arida]